MRGACVRDERGGGGWDWRLTYPGESGHMPESIMYVCMYCMFTQTRKFRHLIFDLLDVVSCCRVPCPYGVYNRMVLLDMHDTHTTVLSSPLHASSPPRVWADVEAPRPGVHYLWTVAQLPNRRGGGNPRRRRRTDHRLFREGYSTPARRLPD